MKSFNLFAVTFVLFLLAGVLYFSYIPLMYILILLLIIIVFLVTHALFTIHYWYTFYGTRVFVIYAFLTLTTLAVGWQFSGVIINSALAANDIFRGNLDSYNSHFQSDIYPVIRNMVMKYLP